MNKTVKLSIQIGLGLVVIALIFVLVRQIMLPIRFQETLAERSAVVIERIKDIRAAEQAFKSKNDRYTASFDTLIDFVLTGELEFERKLVDDDDSVGMAMLKRSGRQNVEKVTVAVRDTIFSPRKLSTDQIERLRFIPFAEEGTEFILGAGPLVTGDGVQIAVFEAKAPYKTYLGDLDEQLLINLINTDKKTLEKYPGIAVGSLTEATNDAGNWE